MRRDLLCLDTHFNTSFFNTARNLTKDELKNILANFAFIYILDFFIIDDFKDPPSLP